MRNIRSMLVTGAAVGAAAVGGGAIANAASSGSSSTASSAAPSTAAVSSGQPAASFPAHGSAAHEDQEKVVTGTAAEKAKAAAVKSAGGGTAGEVTTDFTGNGYEVTVKKSDGTQIEVHLDNSFQAVTGGPGGPGGAPSTSAPGSTYSG